jgi:hypothetical protein
MRQALPMPHTHHASRRVLAHGCPQTRLLACTWRLPAAPHGHMVKPCICQQGGAACTAAVLPLHYQRDPPKAGPRLQPITPNQQHFNTPSRLTIIDCNTAATAGKVAAGSGGYQTRRVGGGQPPSDLLHVVTHDHHPCNRGMQHNKHQQEEVKQRPALYTPCMPHTV